MPDLALDMLGQVALPGRVLDQDHFSGADDRLFPSLAVIFTPASRLMMYWRRGAGCQSMSCSAWVSRKMMPLAGRRFDNLLPRLSSTHSTSMSRKCDWPVASV